MSAEPQRQSWTVDGVERHGLVYAPKTATKAPTPVVFVFHGHGGTMNNAARQFRTHELWPDAITVYPQGLNTPGRLTDPEGKKPGWQSSPGDQGDRDLKLFDAVLKSLRAAYKVDEKRIYATGHSNGGGFTYLLWATRGDVLAAVAPSAAVAGKVVPMLRPKPVLHLAGEGDALVKFEWQKSMIEAIKKVNGVGAEGKKQSQSLTLYASERGTPVVTYIHPGGHQFAADGGKVIVQFFKEHGKPVAAEPATRPRQEP